MASFSVQYIFRLVDQFSGRAPAVTSAANRVKAAVNAAGNAANATAGAFQRMGQAASMAGQHLRSMSFNMRALRTLRHGLSNPFGGALGFGGASFSAFAAGRTLFNFENKMNEVQALMSASDQAMVGLRDKVIDVGAKSRFTSTQVADGLVEIARAGVYDPKQAQALLDGVIGLAEATNTPMSKAADIATNVAKSFGKEINEKDMGEMVDALAHSTRRTNFDLLQLAESMKYVAFNAKKFNIPMKDTTALLMTLAQRGVKGSTAGTGLSRIIEGSLSLSKPARAALESIKIDPKDFFSKDGTFKIFDLIEKFRKAEAKFGKEAAGAAIYKAFGKRGGRIMTALTESTPEEIAKFREIMEGANGAVQEMRDTRMKGLPGAWWRMVAAIEKAILTMGEKGGLTQTLTNVGNKIRDFSLWVSGLSPFWQSLIAHAGLAAAAFSALVIPLGILAMATRAVGPLIWALLFPLRALAGILIGGVLGGVLRGIGGALAAIAAQASAISVVSRLGAAAFLASAAFKMLSRALMIGIAVDGLLVVIQNLGTIKGLISDIANAWKQAGLSGKVSREPGSNWYNLSKSLEDTWFGKAAIGMGLAKPIDEIVQGKAVVPPVDPGRIPQAAAERLQIESQIKGQIDPLQVHADPIQVIVSGQVNGPVSGTGSGQLQSNAPRGVSTQEAGGASVAP